jgi:signal transduction histidine kinase
MDAYELSPVERRHQQELLLMILRLGASLVPWAVVFYASALLRQFSWISLILTVDLSLIFLLSVRGLWRGSLGGASFTARCLIVLILALGLVATGCIEDRQRIPAVLSIPVAILLAIALESPGPAMVWTRLTIALFAVALLGSKLGLPRTDLGPLWDLVSGFVTALSFTSIALLGRIATRHVREALATSEGARGALAQSNTQLEQQKAELQRIDRSLGELTASLNHSNHELQSFAYVVSHDLRTPLRVLNHHTRKLQQDHTKRLDDVGRGHIQSISQSVRHMDALVSGLLAYSSMGEREVPEDEVDVGALLERLVTVLHLRDRADVTLPADAPTVRMHTMQLERVFSNLLENACKFQRPGVRGAVAVEWAARDDAWEFAVRDNGIGIEPRYFQKIFGIFERLHRQSEYEGTGIGLALVKKVVEEHGGKVWVESTPGQGSVFRFTLPRPTQASPAQDPSTPEPDGRRADSLELSPPLRRPSGGDPALSADELRERAALLSLLLTFFAVLAPTLALLYLVPFASHPTWAGLSVPGAPLGLLAVIGWCSWRLRRGEVLRATRVFLASLMIMVARHGFYSSDQTRLIGSLGLAIVLFLAISLEHPSVALRWLGGAVALHLGAAAARSVVPLPTPSMGPVLSGIVSLIPIGEMVLFAVVAHSSARYLRDALARSRSTRAELELSNADLRSQKVELMKQQARLSALATDLDRRNQELKSFAYVASHDLRTPIRALNNYTLFLQQDCAGQLDEGGLEHVRSIAESSRRMDALVSDLLEYSRIGRVKLELEQVNVLHLLERLTASLKLRDRAEVQLAPDLPAIWARGPRLERIFSSLLENAVKLQREGVGPVVAVEWADRGTAWEFAVRDNGVAFDGHQLQRHDVVGQHEGMEIGLLIARKAVEEHGGRIWVEPAPDHGSVFRFTVPKPEPSPTPGARSA